MIVLEMRVERLKEENIEDIVVLSSYIGWDYNRAEVETILTQVLYMAYGMREKTDCERCNYIIRRGVSVNRNGNCTS